MYECRCAVDGKKLAEIARPPLPDLIYRYRCCCGQDRNVPASVDPVTHRVVARDICVCGNKVMEFLGHLVRIKCRACKAIQKF
ncbi:MAG TPA: hypothetical protein VLY20_00075 [Nitrospiria bacterium]|nr:hypothetical protein [Nitrospiria bacterium]